MSVLVLLGVVHRLPRDLGHSLAGAPQLPCDLARTHLRRVQEEEEKEEEEVGRRMKSKETKGKWGEKKEEEYDS